MGGVADGQRGLEWLARHTAFTGPIAFAPTLAQARRRRTKAQKLRRGRIHVDQAPANIGDRDAVGRGLDGGQSLRQKVLGGPHGRNIGGRDDQPVIVQKPRAHQNRASIWQVDLTPVWQGGKACDGRLVCMLKQRGGAARHIARLVKIGLPVRVEPAAVGPAQTGGREKILHRAIGKNHAAATVQNQERIFGGGQGGFHPGSGAVAVGLGLHPFGDIALGGDKVLQRTVGAVHGKQRQFVPENRP